MIDAKTRALIEILRDETQSRAVFDRCNEVLAVAAIWLCTGTTDATSAIQGAINEIHATEAEVEIITGDRK